MRQALTVVDIPPHLSSLKPNWGGVFRLSSHIATHFYWLFRPHLVVKVGFLKEMHGIWGPNDNNVRLNPGNNERFPPIWVRKE